MASGAVTDIVTAWLTANWTATPILVANVDGSVPADGSAFAIIEFPIAAEEQISIGAVGTRVWRESGTFRFVLCAPIGSGLNDPANPWLNRIDALRAVVRGAKYQNVQTWGPGAPEPKDQSDRGAYYELSFSTEFYFDQTF